MTGRARSELARELLKIFRSPGFIERFRVEMKHGGWRDTTLDDLRPRMELLVGDLAAWAGTAYRAVRVRGGLSGLRLDELGIFWSYEKSHAIVYGHERDGAGVSAPRVVGVGGLDAAQVLGKVIEREGEPETLVIKARLGVDRVDLFETLLVHLTEDYDTSEKELRLRRGVPVLVEGVWVGSEWLELGRDASTGCEGGTVWDT